MEGADLDRFCSGPLANSDDELMDKILRAMCKLGMFFKPITFEEHPELGSVAAIYDNYTALRVGYDGEIYRAVAGTIAPPFLYNDFLMYGLPGLSPPHISVYFTGYGRTPEEALAELKRKVEEKAPSYIDAFARLIANIKQLEYMADGTDHYAVEDLIDTTVYAYKYGAEQILKIADMVGANVDIEALRKKIKDAVQEYEYYEAGGSRRREQGEKLAA